MRNQPSVLAPTSRSQQKSWWLNEFVVREGAPGQIGSYVFHADAAVDQMGIRLAFVDATQLLGINSENRASWGALVPMFDHRYASLDDQSLIAIAGYDRSGSAVTANAIRLYDWSATDFVEEATTLRLMYSNPEEMKRSGESCTVTALGARAISGLSAFSGAAWVHPEFRQRGLGEILPVLIKALALARWRVDNVFGMMAKSVFERGFSKRFGFEYEEFAVDWRGSCHGDLILAALWASSDFIATSLPSDALLVRPQIDRRVVDRSAQ